MKTKFTPGPWKFDSVSMSIDAANGGLVAIPRSGGALPGHFENDLRANAALIAAAPEMFEFIETLKVLLSCKDDRGLTLENHIARCCETSEDAQSILDRFDYLISKARGEV